MFVRAVFAPGADAVITRKSYDETIASDWTLLTDLFDAPIAVGLSVWRFSVRGRRAPAFDRRLAGNRLPTADVLGCAHPSRAAGGERAWRSV